MGTGVAAGAGVGVAGFEVGIAVSFGLSVSGAAFAVGAGVGDTAGVSVGSMPDFPGLEQDFDAIILIEIKIIANNKANIAITSILLVVSCRFAAWLFLIFTLSLSKYS